jgi:hypothetical protein
MVIVKMDNSTSNLSSSIVPGRAHVSFSVIMASDNRKYCIDQAIQNERVIYYILINFLKIPNTEWV